MGQRGFNQVRQSENSIAGYGWISMAGFYNRHYKPSYSNDKPDIPTPNILPSASTKPATTGKVIMQTM